MTKAKFWHATDDGHVQCELCPHGCRLTEGQTGLCRVRSACGGQLRADGYGLISSSGVDPIEKKPLYHFHPGSEIFSFGGWGCNFRCDFCQNWTISQQANLTEERFSPIQIVSSAAATGSIGIAYTYNEPLTGYEFVLDCAISARKKGLANVLVTNGYIEPEPAAQLLPYIDALNIDIKSMDDGFYRKKCHGTLAPVLAFARQAVKAGCHVEITNLLIPTLNDDDQLLRGLACWIRDSLGPSTVLHLSAYHPQYKAMQPVTSTGLLEKAHSICSAELMYVYLGNVRTRTGADTLCPKCMSVLITRSGYVTRVCGIKNGSCAQCGRKADII